MRYAYLTMVERISKGAQTARSCWGAAVVTGYLNVKGTFSATP